MTTEEDKGVYVFTWKEGGESHVDGADSEVEAMKRLTDRDWPDLQEWMWYDTDEYEMEFGGIQR